MAETSVSGSIFSNLFWLYMGIALIVGALVIGWLLVALVRFRSRPGMARPADAPMAGFLSAERGHPLWSYVMALVIGAIMFGLAFGTINAVTALETPPEDGDRLEIAITGFQFGWRVNFTGEGGVIVTRVNEWTVPVDTAIVATVRSQDVWHNFALPAYRVRIDAIPGETNDIWWKATETGEVRPVCVQICGNGHALMKSQMHVVSKDDFRAYLQRESEVEYQKIERAGNVLNVTYDGASFSAESKQLNFTKPAAIRIANAGSAPERFTLGENVVEVAAGQTRMISLAGGGRELTSASGATYNLGSVS